MSRAASPLKEDRSTKRTKTSMASEMVQLPENIADIVDDGDAILVLEGMGTAPDKPIGLRVSTHALSLASPVIKGLCAAAASNSGTSTSDSPSEKVISVLEDDGDAMYILVNILHLRNDKIPARLAPSLLCGVAALAHKYQCVVAAGRATLQWFDRLYVSSTPSKTWEIVEAAYLLDEAMSFARFSARWVLQESLRKRQIPVASSVETQKLAVVLADHCVQSRGTLRDDLDTLVDSAACVFSEDYVHYIDYAPGMDRDPEDPSYGNQSGNCRVDPDGAAEYLGALRDAGIWPSTVWATALNGGNGPSIGDIVEKVKNFREPAYNDADKCEFCEDVKTGFTKQLVTTKKDQEQRLWGLCLDCYKAGGFHAGECRYEHAKP